MAYLPNSEKCYVCGRSNPLGLQVRFRVEGDEVVTDFTADEDRCGFSGVVHGGVLSALLDETMGWAAAFRKKRFCYAAELRLRFLRPTPTGEPLTITGRMTADRGRVWETEGEIRGGDSVYARAWGKFMPMSPEQTIEVIGYLCFDEGTVPRDAIGPIDAASLRTDSDDPAGTPDD